MFGVEVVWSVQVDAMVRARAKVSVQVHFQCRFCFRSISLSVGKATHYNTQLYTQNKKKEKKNTI